MSAGSQFDLYYRLAQRGLVGFDTTKPNQGAPALKRDVEEFKVSNVQTCTQCIVLLVRAGCRTNITGIAVDYKTASYYLVCDPIALA
ncbi:hypothetical protein TWF225_002267 [Orbilia oligospora]|nr:hypothetical protein TWF225_002267 [Orbilia oligospora]